MKIKDLLIPYSCINCGTCLVNQTRLCKNCFNLLYSEFSQNEVQVIHNLKIFYLLNWIPHASETLSILHLELKNTHPNIWHWFARKIHKQLLHLNLYDFFSRAPIIISLKSGKGKNHSESWGEALAKEFGFQHIAGLKKSEQYNLNREQKNSSILERNSILLEPCVDLTRIYGKPIIFADDILTTGATLKEAYRVLGRPDHFLGLFISYRKLH